MCTQRSKKKSNAKQRFLQLFKCNYMLNIQDYLNWRIFGIFNPPRSSSHSWTRKSFIFFRYVSNVPQFSKLLFCTDLLRWPNWTTGSSVSLSYNSVTSLSTVVCWPAAIRLNMSWLSSASLASDNLISFLHLTANLWKNSLAEYDQNYLNSYGWFADRQHDSMKIFLLWNQAKTRLKFYFLWRGFLSHSAVIGISTVSFESSWFNNFEL